MQLWHKLEQDKRFSKLLMGVIALQCVLILLLWLGWRSAPKQLTIHIPPQLESGATLQSGEVHEAALYAFTHYVWQSFNHWPEDGAKDYPDNLQRYRYLMTPQFLEQMKKTYQELLLSGEAQSRVRIMRGAVGAAFEAEHVKRLGPDLWQVNITVRVTEYVRGVAVKDIDVHYPLRVTRYDVNREYNPWGLAIDGFVSPPKRLKQYQLEPSQ